jgi:hypothetical protein
MVLFDSLLDQFVGSFAGAWVFSIFEFDADWFIYFSSRILTNRFNGLETFFLSLIYKNQRSRLTLELMVIFVSIYNFKTRWTQLFRWFNGGSDDTAPLLTDSCCFFWRSGLSECWILSYVRNHWFGCSLRPWDAVKFTLESLDVGFICPFVVIDRRIPAFLYRMVTLLKLACVCMIDIIRISYINYKLDDIILSIWYHRWCYTFLIDIQSLLYMLWFLCSRRSLPGTVRWWDQYRRLKPPMS